MTDRENLFISRLDSVQERGDEVRAFVGGFIQGGRDGVGVQFGAVGIFQDLLKAVIEPVIVKFTRDNERHAVMHAGDGAVGCGGEDDKAVFPGDLIPQASETETGAVGPDKAEGARRIFGVAAASPFVKAIGGNEAALVQPALEGVFGLDGFSLGIEERAVVPGDGPAEAHFLRVKASGAGRNDGGRLGGSDVVPGFHVNGALESSDGDDETAIGSEGITGAHNL